MENSEDYNLLFNYYLTKSMQKRQEAVKLLKERNFDELLKCYRPYFHRQERETTIHSLKLSDLITELQSIQIDENETEPIISVRYEQEEEQEGNICLYSELYSIVKDSHCVNLARSEAQYDLTKMERQPDGIEAKDTLNLLSKLKNQN